jgi:hypothetical protein
MTTFRLARSPTASLVGTARATTGFSYTIPSGGGLPSWLIFPTQLDEQLMYDNVLGWAWIPADKATNFATVPPASFSPNVHNDTEADDLWNHYVQYKRTLSSNPTAAAIHLAWAQKWRDYYVSSAYETNMNSTCTTYGDHLYGSGLVVWGVERNDQAAKDKAEFLLGTIETAALGQTPGVTSVSTRETRKNARWLQLACYVTMMNPSTRWTTLRDHLINCWIQSPGWADTTHPTVPTQIGGNHFCGRPQTSSESFEGWLQGEYDAGFRWNHSFEYGMHAESLWLAYKMTNRTDVKNMLIEMARYVLFYAWDPLHVNPLMGSRWGHRQMDAPVGMGSPGHLHAVADEYGNDTSVGAGNPGYPGVPIVPFPPLNTNPNAMWCVNYESSVVGILTYGYKLTGEVAFLNRAKEHFRQATGYANATVIGQLKLAQNEVHHYLDTQRNSDLIYFNWNKGELQYAYPLMENAGVPAVEGTWPPYQVPTLPGQVIQIAGQAAVFNASKGTAWGGGSTYETNVFADVRPTEIGSITDGNLMLIGNDGGCTFLPSYSRGGAIGCAGSGGHHGTMHFGGAVFDFEDGRWKRHWTGGHTTQNKELLTGTRIHGCLNWEDDLHDTPRTVGGSYGHNDDGTPGTQANPGTFSGLCMNYEHWDPVQGNENTPLTPDPRDQTWEVTRPEFYPWSATKIPPGASGSNTSPITSGPHGWKFPGEYAGLQFGITGKNYGGFVGASARLTPTPGLPMPVPGHTWDHQFEVTPAQGGGPQGSVAFCRNTYAGHASSIAQQWSWRFQWDTGVWHEYSVNESRNLSVINSSTGGGEPWLLDGSTASCHDPVADRIYLIGQHAGNSSENRLNYMNHSDRRWRNMATGMTGTTLTDLGYTENIKCDPVRRLLILSCGGGFFFRLMNISNLVGEPNPTTAVGGWQVPPDCTAAPGFTLPPNGTNLNNSYNYGWHFYPPNGKYYKLDPEIPGASTMTQTQYDSNSANWVITQIERLTPPPIVDPFPATVDYYIDQPWVYDKITLDTPVPRPGFQLQKATAVGNKWFWYIPSIQCFAWLPQDATNPTEAESRRGVYLIKPY